MFRQGNLFDIFSRQSEGRDGKDIAPDAAARARAEADGRPVDVFDVSDNSERGKRERLHQSLQSGSLMGSGFTGANDKKAKEERSMRDEWLERVVMGRMTASQWDAQMTWVGGVQMTNGQERAIRKWALNNFDEFFDMGVKKGRFKDSDKDDVRMLLQKLDKLKDKQRDNPAEFSKEDEAELNDLKLHPLIRPVEETQVECLSQFNENKLMQSTVLKEKSGADMPGKAAAPRLDFAHAASALQDMDELERDVGVREPEERPASTPSPGTGMS